MPAVALVHANAGHLISAANGPDTTTTTTAVDALGQGLDEGAGAGLGLAQMVPVTLRAWPPSKQVMVGLMPVSVIHISSSST